jgi:isocitrate/isopropylmalate dehydrogenase
VRPVKLYEGVQHRIHGQNKQVWTPGQVDMVMIRENTEGLYTPDGRQALARRAHRGRRSTRA